MLSTRENFMRLLRCELPEYVPTYNLFWGLTSPSCFRREDLGDGVTKDQFGVTWVSESNAGPVASIPKPGTFILDDIRKWRDIIKVPDTSDVDWEALAKTDTERRDPEMPFGTQAGGIFGFFQGLVAFMGFNEGLMACFEEPDEVKALMEYLCDFAVANIKKIIEYYKPDYGMLADDIAHEHNPFLSLPMFQDVIAPSWRRYAAAFLEEGLPMMHHNCGHFEEYLDDLVDMGYSGWDPVQNSNDIIAIKAKFGNRLALCGGWIGKSLFEIGMDASEEEVRNSIKTTMDTLAPGGGFAMFGVGGFPSENPDIQRRNEWIRDEYDRLKFTYYQ
ncbi:MAG: hypothetical protein FWG88_10235 [Oscillospiraceae bacterium]|nr:hypothetical protein [Oscillospiraceae bacterium]